MKTRLLFSIIFFSMLLPVTRAQWMYSDLAEPKLRMGCASLGAKAYFAGGDNTYENLTAVEIYDVSTGSWSYENLSVARSFPAGVSCGSKVFFAGGYTDGFGTYYDVVDIYDTLTGEWTVEHLTVPRFSISAVAHPQYNKVLFAGGINLNDFTAYSIVDIYNMETGEWDTTHLSLARGAMSAAVVGDLAIFAGGFDLVNYTDRVDIYNFETGTWTMASLGQPRGFTGAGTVGNKVFVAGGMIDPYIPESPSYYMDVYDNTTGAWSVKVFPNARAFVEMPQTINDSLIFAGGGNFYGAGGAWASASDLVDIYDAGTGLWTIEHLTHPLVNHSVTSIVTQDMGYLMVAGGTDVATYFSTVEIMMCPTVGVEEVGSQQSAVSAYPNPTQGIVDFRFSMADFRWVSLKVYNAQGQEVATVLDGTWSGGQVVRWDASALPAGIYIYRISTIDNRQSTMGKIVKY
jgi:hypothetical protein